jgi:hypothetical protein
MPDINVVLVQLAEESEAKDNENTDFTQRKMYKHAENCFGQQVGMARAIELIKQEFGI